eukprot:4149286-Amphidinium_carterae.2
MADSAEEEAEASVPSVDVTSESSGANAVENPAKRRRCREDGPVTASEALQWARELLGNLAQRTASLRGEHASTIIADDFMDRLSQVMSAGLDLTTDYSGIGSAEEAARHIGIAWLQRKADRATDIRSLKAGDLSSNCRRFLMSPNRASRSQCVFGDLMERAPAKFLRHVKAARAKSVSRCEVLQDMGWSKAAAVEEAGKELLAEAICCALHYHDLCSSEGSSTTRVLIPRLAPREKRLDNGNKELLASYRKCLFEPNFA